RGRTGGVAWRRHWPGVATWRRAPYRARDLCRGGSRDNRAASWRGADLRDRSRARTRARVVRGVPHPRGPTCADRAGDWSAPRAETAVRRFLEFTGDAVLVAHNARFDLSFLDRETERLIGARLAAPVVDTVGLARRLLAGRGTRFGLGALAHFFGTEASPCHRALPDAQATAEILVA